MIKTAEKQACERLRELIIDGKVPVGEFLSQRKLAELVGTAVGTVRGALRRLENEGLIESIPKWGVRVPVMTEELARDRNFMREVYETAAVRKIAGSLRPDEADRLMELATTCDEFKQHDCREGTRAFAEIHLAFHQHIADCTHSTMLSEALANLLARDRMVYNARFGWSGNRTLDPEHHRRMAQAIIEGPVEEAVALMTRHVRDGLKAELAALESLQKS